MQKLEAIWCGEDYDDDDEYDFELTDSESEILKVIQETFDTVETFEHFVNNEYLESYWETKTIQGVSVTAFGKYGYDC